MPDDIVYFETVETTNPGSSTAVAISHQQEQLFNPAQAYVLTLSAGQSRNKVIRILNSIAQAFGYADLNVCPWQEMNYDRLLAYRTMQVEAGLAPATINLQLCTLRMVAKQAWLKRMMTLETYTAIRELKSVRGKRVSKGRALNSRETGKLLASLDLKQSSITVRDAAIIALAVGCGMRRAEVVGLTFNQLDKSNRIITILGKGNKERRVAPSDEAWERLEEWLSLRGEDGCENVFVAVKKGDNIQPYWPLTESAIYQMLKNRGAQATVANFTPHDLRRTFATRLLDNGADINTVRLAMGHESIVTTQRYDKRDEHRVAEVTRKVSL